MFSRVRLALGLAIVLSLILVLPAFAGGWAVITLDELPSDVVAGAPLTVGFTVLQHGVTPMDGLEPTIIANLHKEQEFAVNAEPDGKPGHYTATFTFPKEGEWRWFIRAFSMEQLMPMLTVAAPAGATANQSVGKSESVTVPISALIIFRALALAVGLVCALFAFQRKSRLALALTGVAICLVLASFAVGATVPAAEAQTQGGALSRPADTTISQAELGERLYVAKGCITCHVNNRVALASEYWTIEMGAPDLSNYSAHPEILFIRLKDPAAAKSDTKMPNLGLKKTEIEALIAFLNSK